MEKNTGKAEEFCQSGKMGIMSKSCWLFFLQFLTGRLPLKAIWDHYIQIVSRYSTRKEQNYPGFKTNGLKNDRVLFPDNRLEQEFQ